MTEHTHLGTVSHGTMRYVDLIPTFYEYLRTHNAAPTFSDRDQDIYDIVNHSNSDMDLRDAEMEDAGYLLEMLMQEMEELAPVGYYFGAHPGDGSDYGFWEVEND